MDVVDGSFPIVPTQRVQELNADRAGMMREYFDGDARIDNGMSKGDGKCCLNQCPYAGEAFIAILMNMPEYCAEIGGDIAKSDQVGGARSLRGLAQLPTWGNLKKDKTEGELERELDDIGNLRSNHDVRAEALTEEVRRVCILGSKFPDPRINSSRQRFYMRMLFFPIGINRDVIFGLFNATI